MVSRIVSSGPSHGVNDHSLTLTVGDIKDLGRNDLLVVWNQGKRRFTLDSFIETQTPYPRNSDIVMRLPDGQFIRVFDEHFERVIRLRGNALDGKPIPEGHDSEFYAWKISEYDVNTLLSGNPNEAFDNARDVSWLQMHKGKVISFTTAALAVATAGLSLLGFTRESNLPEVKEASIPATVHSAPALSPLLEPEVSSNPPPEPKLELPVEPQPEPAPKPQPTPGPEIAKPSTGPRSGFFSLNTRQSNKNLDLVVHLKGNLDSLHVVHLTEQEGVNPTVSNTPDDDGKFSFPGLPCGRKYVLSGMCDSSGFLNPVEIEVADLSAGGGVKVNGRSFKVKLVDGKPTVELGATVVSCISGLYLDVVDSKGREVKDLTVVLDGWALGEDGKPIKLKLGGESKETSRRSQQTTDEKGRTHFQNLLLWKNTGYRVLDTHSDQYPLLAQGTLGELATKQSGNIPFDENSGVMFMTIKLP